MTFPKSSKKWNALILIATCLGASACSDDSGQNDGRETLLKPDFSLSESQTHSKFSRSIEPAVSVPSGSVVEAFTHEATGGQFDVDSSVGDLAKVNMDLVHTLTGPVFVEGAKPGDTHAVQGLGEVSGTALEAPMRIVYRISVLKNARPIQEVQYETNSYYATTGFATTIDEAAQKATRFMVDYLYSYIL